MKKIGLLLAALALVFLFLSAAAAEEPVTISISFDKDTYVLGTEVTITYRISGGDGNLSQGGYMINMCLDGKYIGHADGDLDLEKKTGTIKVTPKAGEEIYIVCNVYDADGNLTRETSPRIPLTGDVVVDPIIITTTFRKSTYEINEDITAYIEISGGSGTHRRGEYNWYVLDHGERVKISTGSLNGMNSGILWMRPQTGEKAFVEYILYEYDGNTYTFESETVDLIPEHLHVSMDLDQKTYERGTEIRCAYELRGGSGTYTSGKYTVYEQINRKAIHTVSGELDLVRKSGVIRYTPQTGNVVDIVTELDDTDGTHFSIHRGYIFLTGVPVTVYTVYDQESYDRGDTIKADYNLFGVYGQKFSQGTYTCCSTDESTTYIISTGSLDTTGNSGQIVFTPTEGDQAYIVYEVYDEEGKKTVITSPAVNLAVPLDVTVTFNPESAEIGTEVAASYRIIGGSGTYTSGTYECCLYGNDGTITQLSSGKLNLKKKTGTIRFTPKKAGYAYLRYTVEDSDGKAVQKSSQQIPVIKRPLSVVIDLDRESCPIGTEITATYRISGGTGNYTYGEYRCYSGDGWSDIFICSGELDTARKTGTIRFTPRAGDSAFIVCVLYDTDGDERTFSSDTVFLTGAPDVTVDPIEVENEFSQTSYKAGTEVKASYQISGGNGEYTIADYTCLIWDGTEMIRISSGNLNTVRKKGTIRFIPRMGVGAMIIYRVYDSDGRMYESMVGVPITGSPDPGDPAATPDPLVRIHPGQTERKSYRSTSLPIGSVRSSNESVITVAMNGMTGQALSEYALTYTGVSPGRAAITLYDPTGKLIETFTAEVEEHGKPVTVKGKPATCTETGLTDGTKCDICGVMLTKQEVIPAKGHTTHQHKAVKATCTEDGTEAYWSCTVCEKLFADKAGKTVIKAPAAVPKLGHQMKKYAMVEPTADAPGTEAYWECTRCHKLFSDGQGQNEIQEPVTIPIGEIHAHSLVKHGKVNATCTRAGTKAYWECAGCGKLFSDAKGKNPIKKPETIAALGHALTKHDLVEATQTAEGTEAYWECTRCHKLFSDGQGQNEIQEPVIIPIGETHIHQLVKHNQVDATCTEAGTKAFWECTGCGQLFSDSKGKKPIREPETIPAPGHALKKHKQVDATCTEAGTKAYWECTRCHQLFSDSKGMKPIWEPEVIPAPGHTLKKHKQVDATCTEAGVKAFWECTSCGRLFSDSKGKKQIKQPEAIPAQGHTLKKHKQVDATCTEAGVKACWECTRCHQLFSDAKGTKAIREPEVISALGHALVKHEKVEATNMTEGTEAYWECRRCHKLFSDAKGKHEIEKPVVIPMKDKIAAFVARCYQLILGRNYDPHGLETWYINLNSGQKAAAEIIDSFVRSNEFKGKNHTNEESVEILYNTMLGRGSDAAGKANWVAKLNAGQPLAAVINGFCGSNEFKAICNKYGIRPGSVDVPEEVPTTPDEKIKAFVKRCYKIILGRGADETGLNNWFNYLKSKQKAASEIIDGFVNSPEFLGKNYSSEESVEILYKAMLGRGSDPKGKANWVAKLNAGQPFAVVINGFCGSQEFRGLCESYGIIPGSVKVKALSGQSEEELSGLAYNAEEPITKRSEDNPNRVEIINPSDTIDPNIGTAVQAVYINEEKAKEYVSRCYQYILGRSASENELAGWVAQMTNGTKTADQIARGFLFSEEFKGRNVGSLDLVKILYRVYLNRDADPAGLASWTAKLDSGMTLKEVLDSLVKTSEYKNVISEMGK